MSETTLWLMLGGLVLLILLSGFFSSSETALMAMNRYRLRHLADQGKKGALRAQKLLSEPDKLIGVILLGNNFVNILASALATILAVHFWGDQGVAISTTLLTIVILVFAEVTPKTLAVNHPERIALPASLPLQWLLKLLFPLVWLVNQITRALLRLLGEKNRDNSHQLSTAELKAAVHETAHLGHNHQSMLVNILELSDLKVEEVMVPRNEIIGLDLEEDWPLLVKRMTAAYYTRFPVYRGDLNQLEGILHIRQVVQPLARGALDKEQMLKLTRKPYFIPMGTTLARQLLEFQQRERRMAMVVDEYGDIQGLVTLDDILEEIVGEYTSEPVTRSRYLTQRGENEFMVDGRADIRSLNRRMGWALPDEEARTLNGLLLEQLETIPKPDTRIRIGNLDITILKVKDNHIKTVRIVPVQPENSPEGEHDQEQQ